MVRLIQLAGAPGSGKSTLARELAKRYDAVVLDTDVVKTALLDAGVPWGMAGKAGYNVLFALADDMLGNGRGVVIDSPSHYETIPARGMELAQRHGVAYRFVECVCADVAELQRRLTSRTARRSQVPEIGALPAGADAPSPAVRLGEHKWQTYGPPGGHLVLDTGQALDRALAEAVRYVGETT